MKPLDLTSHAPRSPREELAGLCMLPRTIDKLRALLPGGNPGDYKIDGFSRRLLDAIGIEEGALLEAVARAQDDAEVAAWVSEHGDLSNATQINAQMHSLTIGERLKTRPDLAERYPVIRELGLPAETTLFRVLELDDAASF